VVDVVVAVDEPVSQTDDRKPRDTRSARLLLGRNAAARLANDFEQPDESKSQQAIGIQIATTASAHEVNDFLSMVPHLPKAHRGITPRHTDPRPPQGPGCTEFLVDEQTDKFRFLEENERVIANGGRPAQRRETVPDES
jgi:hypothetical protein